MTKKKTARFCFECGDQAVTQCRECGCFLCCMCEDDGYCKECKSETYSDLYGENA